MANPEHLEILRQGVEVWNRWREENLDTLPDLRDANLRGIDLSGADFERAALLGADLREADLRRAQVALADLSFAHLSAANLCDADFSWAYLIGTDLRRASFCGADLSGANFTLAYLNGADLSDAALSLTVFGNTSLRNCGGLNGLRHQYQSVLDPATVMLSGGLPEAFLRGVGWPERLIEYWSSIVEQEIRFCSCFISYGHEDKAFARQLHDQLQGRGIRCWLDEHELLPGDDLKDMIDRGIRRWDKVLLCCSEASLTSWWVDQEIEKALQIEEQLWKDRGERTLKIIPLNLDGYLFDGWESGHKSMITRRLAADFVGWERDSARFEEELEKVVMALSTDELARGIPPEQKL